MMNITKLSLKYVLQFLVVSTFFILAQLESGHLCFDVRLHNRHIVHCTTIVVGIETFDEKL